MLEVYIRCQRALSLSYSRLKLKSYSFAELWILSLTLKAFRFSELMKFLKFGSDETLLCNFEGSL